MQKSKLPSATDDTHFATSSGLPILFTGVKPSEINYSYYSLTFEVISVSMMPGLISITLTPYSASLEAKSLVIIDIPALEMQYSPLLTEAVYADIEEIFTILDLLFLISNGVIS